MGAQLKVTLMLLGIFFGLTVVSSYAAWNVDIVESDGNVGSYCFTTIDPSKRNFAIVYYDTTNGNVKICHGQPGSWSFDIIDSEGNVGKYPSLAIHSNGQRHAVYQDVTNTGIKYAGPLDYTWHPSFEVVDINLTAGPHFSLILNPTNNDYALTYYDSAEGNIKLAQGEVGSWSIETIDSEGNVGKYPSLAIHSNGQRHAVYQDVTNTGIKYAGPLDYHWTVTSEVLESTGDVGSHIFTAIGPSDQIALAYYNATNQSLYFTNQATSGQWNAAEVVDNVNDVGTFASLAISPANDVFISYRDATNGWARFAYRSLPSIDKEENYCLNLAVSYFVEQQTARILVYAYDTVSGSLVSMGQGSYRISQGNQMIVSGSLLYSDSARVWDSGNVAMTGTGKFLVAATINGHYVYASFVIGSLSTVHLTGTARDGDGNPISGVTIKLYNASAVLGAADLDNLPSPLAIATSSVNGEFDFGDLPNGQYILIFQTDNGITIGRVFWLRDGEETHSEILVENPGRTDVLDNLFGLRESIQEHIVNQQTEWMMDVANTVDGDLDATPDLVDWCLLAGNIVSGTAANFGMAWAAGLSPSHFGDIAGEVTVDSLTNQGLTIAGTITAVESTSLNNQALAAKGALAQPYFAYGETAIQELTEIDSVLSADIKLLLDPNLHTPFLEMAFRRDDPMHRHSRDWFQTLGSYTFANDWLNNYHASAVENLPNLPETLSVNRAESVLVAADNQLRALGSGTGLIFVSPNPEEYSSEDALFEPLALNLTDYYQKYQVGRSKKEIADWIKKGSSVVSIGGHAVAAASAAGVVSAPGAAVAETVALAASAVSFGAAVIQAGIKADMVGTYVHMSSKYCANLLTAPLVLKRTEDFLISETTNPYYLNPSNSFEGSIEDVTLGGLNIGGREVFFPLQVTLLPFCPPIQLTSTKVATVDFGNPAGDNSSAFYRIESKVLDFSGAHDHVVTNGGELYAGQTTQVQIPFHGHLMANSVLSAGTLETRLWVGPFQSPSEHCIVTRDFVVIPINIGGLPSPLGKGQDIEMEMKKPLHFVRTEEQFLSSEDIIAMADRVRERYEAALAVGSNIIERTYTFSNDIFECEFRLYRPHGTQVSFYVEKDGEYVGWDPITDTVHHGFPGEYSGKDANPESIIVPNCGGETVNVRLELGDITTDPVNLLLEVWERPNRDAIMAVLPDSISIRAETGGIRTVEIAVGESSHQKPLQDVTLSLSELKNEAGNSLAWSSVVSFDTDNVMAGGVRTYLIEINTENAFGGTYTGTVTVGSSNAGTVEVPVEVTVQYGNDNDNDGLPDIIEGTICTDPNDADTDDDGIPDGVEDANHNGMADPGETDSCDIDTDGDGIQDGTELGYTLNDIGLDTDLGIFQPDLDPTTTTDPLNPDTDGDGFLDGEEDTNHNGRVDPGEIDPDHISGDINGDGNVDLTDAILAIQIVCDITPTQTVYEAADVNGDDKIGIEELIYILQKLSGLR